MYEVKVSEFYKKWLKKIKDPKTRARILKYSAKLSCGVMSGDKHVGAGVYEQRLDFGPGYRLYYMIESQQVIILLLGGNKTGQQRDIQKAIKIKKELYE